ncbi:hypothetical protein JS530_03070 [Bifidobacterium sp. LC6]|uniref:Permease n=1 Tax=Bifidobacterium colobi TaxID=2809026 RepID=A0ABS5UV34_9BIFI|nr:hypothetical protein [Bifidobacterium colobi]MBT1174499.1 hypothetical protein [Bifidobacterium colobi]
MSDDDYERYGLFATACGGIPVAGPGRRAASVWSLLWRVFVLVAGMVVLAFPHALYAAQTGDKLGSPGVLAWLGITGATWWGVLVLIPVFALGGLAPAIMVMLAAAGKLLDGHRWVWPFVAVMLTLMVMVWAILPGNAAGQSLMWWRLFKNGTLYGMPSSNGLLSMLPGVIGSTVAVLLVIVLWCTVGGVLRRGSTKDSLWSRVMYAMTPTVCLGIGVLRGLLPAGGETVLGVLMLAVLLGLVVPNELSAAAWCVRTKREARWMWAFASAVTFESLLSIMMVVAFIYQL